ncbi:MAG: NTP transferase domain-containing protein, partial [Pseudomonadota bacterium]
MEFGPISASRAEGAILAHSVRAGKKTFKKGRTLSAGDLEILAEAGIDEVIAARLGADDVHEDEAAAEVAAAIAGPHATVAEAFTGRANIYSTEPGLALIDEFSINEINRLDEALTIATVPPFEAVGARQMLATVKIIPFALSRETLAKALSIARRGQAVSVAPFVRKRAHLIISRLPQTKPTVITKTVDVIRGRLEECGAALGGHVVCGHTVDDVAAAISAIPAEDTDPVLVFGASAIVDRDDVIPAGLEAAGGDVVHLGMPVDPGNLLMYGRRGKADVIGVPSCARSPKLNGFDWILQRVLAGLTIRRQDIMGLGVGGLLKEIPSRPRPRERTPAEPQTRIAPNVSAVVLAAGRSTRMGPENKLLKAIDGKAMVRRSVESLIASGVGSITVVTGHERGK